MSCDICGRERCAAWFHSGEEQHRYESVIDAFERARALRHAVRLTVDEEEAAHHADTEEDQP
jgi:hypothetical protein